MTYKQFLFKPHYIPSQAFIIEFFEVLNKYCINSIPLQKPFYVPFVPLSYSDTIPQWGYSFKTKIA
jgi:hypothetical protein